jgi:hypothetical protein
MYNFFAVRFLTFLSSFWTHRHEYTFMEEDEKQTEFREEYGDREAAKVAAGP